MIHHSLTSSLEGRLAEVNTLVGTAEFLKLSHHHLLRGRRNGDLHDELTGSCYNVDSAAVIIDLQIKMISEGILSASDNATITRYTAQQRLHELYALNRLVSSRVFEIIGIHMLTVKLILTVSIKDV